MSIGFDWRLYNAAWRDGWRDGLNGLANPFLGRPTDTSYAAGYESGWRAAQGQREYDARHGHTFPTQPQGCPDCKKLRRYARMTGLDQHRWRGPDNCTHGFYAWYRRLSRWLAAQAWYRKAFLFIFGRWT
jgi:hypothetical protein